MHEELPATQKLFLKHDVTAVALAGLQESFGQHISALCHETMARFCAFSQAVNSD